MRSLIWVLACAACGGPANVAGTWTFDLTFRDNPCNVPNWTVGGTANGVMVSVTQASGDATADVSGVGGLFLEGALADHVYTGPVDGEDIDLEIFGTKSTNQGNCTYTYNSEMLGTVNGNSLLGEIHYTAATNGNPDCSSLQGCLSLQEFAASRAPQ